MYARTRTHIHTHKLEHTHTQLVSDGEEAAPSAVEESGGVPQQHIQELLAAAKRQIEERKRQTQSLLVSCGILHCLWAVGKGVESLGSVSVCTCTLLMPWPGKVCKG